MAIDVTLTCSMCGTDRTVSLVDNDCSPYTQLKRVVEIAEWIGQSNGNNYDTYCSKKCAE